MVRAPPRTASGSRSASAISSLTRPDCWSGSTSTAPGYRIETAHRMCHARRAGLRRKRISRPQWRIVEAGLRQDWSAEQIYGVMRLKELMPVSHERIYQHVYADKRRGGALHKHLRCQKQRRKRRGVFNMRGLKRFAKNLNHRFSRNVVPRAIVACVPPLADASG